MSKSDFSLCIECIQFGGKINLLEHCQYVMAINNSTKEIFANSVKINNYSDIQYHISYENGKKPKNLSISMVLKSGDKFYYSKAAMVDLERINIFAKTRLYFNDCIYKDLQITVYFTILNNYIENIIIDGYEYFEHKYVNENPFANGSDGIIYLLEKNETKYVYKYLNFQKNHKLLKRELLPLLTVPEHNNIVKLVGYSMNGIVLEYAPFKSLDQIDMKTLKTMHKMMIIRDILLGLAHLHKYGIIHKDIKPKNILIFENYVAKICDFGISHPEDSAHSYDRGTPLYKAREAESLNYDYRCDIYSLGVLILYLFEGKIDESSIESFKKGKYLIRVPIQTQFILRSMLSDDPSERPLASELLILMQLKIFHLPMKIWKLDSITDEIPPITFTKFQSDFSHYRSINDKYYFFHCGINLFYSNDKNKASEYFRAGMHLGDPYCEYMFSIMNAFYIRVAFNRETNIKSLNRKVDADSYRVFMFPEFWHYRSKSGDYIMSKDIGLSLEERFNIKEENFFDKETQKILLFFSNINRLDFYFYMPKIYRAYKWKNFKLFDFQIDEKYSSYFKGLNHTLDPDMLKSHVYIRGRIQDTIHNRYVQNFIFIEIYKLIDDRKMMRYTTQLYTCNSQEESYATGSSLLKQIENIFHGSGSKIILSKLMKSTGKPLNNMNINDYGPNISNRFLELDKNASAFVKYCSIKGDPLAQKLMAFSMYKSGNFNDAIYSLFISAQKDKEAAFFYVTFNIHDHILRRDIDEILKYFFVFNDDDLFIELGILLLRGVHVIQNIESAKDCFIHVNDSFCQTALKYISNGIYYFYHYSKYHRFLENIYNENHLPRDLESEISFERLYNAGDPSARLEYGLKFINEGKRSLGIAMIKNSCDKDYYPAFNYIYLMNENDQIIYYEIGALEGLSHCQLALSYYRLLKLEYENFKFWLNHAVAQNLKCACLISDFLYLNRVLTTRLYINISNSADTIKQEKYKCGPVIMKYLEYAESNGWNLLSKWNELEDNLRTIIQQEQNNMK